MICSICGHRDAVIMLKDFKDGKLIFPLCEECCEKTKTTFCKKMERALLYGEDNNDRNKR